MAQRRVVWLGILVFVGAMLMGFLLNVDNFVGAKIIGRNLGAVRVLPGETVDIRFTTNATIPAVQVKLCRDNLAVPEGCIVLVRRVEGRQTPIVIPTTYPLGKAVVVVTNYTAEGELGATQYREKVVVIKP